MEWMFNGKEYTEKHNEDLYGFIYLVYFEDGKGDLYKYYGKKKWFSEVKKHFGKRKLEAMEDKRMKKYEIVKKDNDWKTYIGSSKDTIDYIPVYKEIICFARSQRELTYLETKVLFQRGALEDDMCLNANIMGKYFRGNLV